MEGFGVLTRIGAPAVPVRIERIGIPAGTSPVLRVLGMKSRAIPGLRPEPVPGLSSAGGPSGPEGEDPGGRVPGRRLPRPDAALYARDADYPPEPVKLGAVGRLRDQWYVDLIFTPVQVNPVTGSGRWAEEIEVEVSFRAAPGAAARPAGGKGRDRRFEEFYRRGLLNYDQASSFRLSPEASSASLPETALPEAETSGTVYKIALHRDGIYRISCSSVPSCSVPDLLGQDPGTFRLRDRGVEVPLRVEGGSDHSFDLGDTLEFYGESVKEPFTIVNCAAPADPTCLVPIYEYNDATDVNVYLLDATGSADRLRMSSVDGTPGGLSAEPDFLDTAHVEVNDRFLPLGGHDPYYWIPTLTADAVNSAFRDISIPLPGISSAAFTAAVTARLRGVSYNDAVSPDHRTRITLNSNSSTTTTQDWDGETLFDHATSAAGSVLTNPSTLRLEVPAVPTISLDQVIADYVEISYRRLFQADSDRLAFTFPNQAAKFLLGGFSGSPVMAYDLSRTLAGSPDITEPRLVLNGSPGPGTLTFEVASEGSPTGDTRRFLAVGPGGFLSPDSVTPRAADTLLDPANEADYVILSHPSLIDLAPGSAYDRYVAYLEGVRGLKVRLVFIDSVYDEFNDSLQHPEAIRAFLAYAHDNWAGPGGTSSPPSHLLLVGDAVWDLKNNLNWSDWVHLVPTPIMFYDQAILKYYAADNWLASFLGDDQSADILYGRVPARTLEQAEAVFSKFLAYAQSAPAGAWRSDGYFLADVGNTVQETEKFELVADQAAVYFQSPWTQTQQYYAQPPYSAPTGGGGPVEEFKADFVSHWNGAHPAVATFTGHGAFDILGNDIFFRSSDVPLLTNGAYQPFFFNSDCLSGGFHAVGLTSIGEAFLESSTGGSIAFFGPAGLSYTYIGNLVSGQIFSDLFSIRKVRELGTLASNARDVLYQQGSFVDLQGYVLLGDPSLDLVLPAPRPPADFTVTSGNARVDLAWTASTDPSAAGTDIYRTQYLTQPYTKVNGAPVTGTSYADTTVVNGTTYFYRAVSVDAGGFEGAVTNTNEDCGTTASLDGPECRRALPLNLTPPVAVQGVKVRDTGTGSTLDVSWSASPETDILKYRVAYGTAPGSHPVVKDAGLATSYTLAGLSPGVPYYVVVWAVNTSGVEGAPSAEVSGTPHIFFGIAPPRTIQDLTVTRSGDDLVLAWSAVTTNIYGNPTTVDHYNVYRNSTPVFVPSDTVNRIAVVPAGASPSFTHAGGALTADDGYYLVSAMDSDGFASGLGSDLPGGIADLVLEPSATPGYIRLSWSPVSVTVKGDPARISHYALYGSTAPLPRRLVGPTNLLQDNLMVTFVEVPDPAVTAYYYNVIVVDERGNLSPY